MKKLTRNLKVQLPLALGISLISSYSMRLPAYSVDQLANSSSPSAGTDSAKPVTANTMSIRNIYSNDAKQLVIEFDNPTHLSPLTPQIRDNPGQKHDIVLEFSQTAFATDKTPKAKVVLDDLMKVYPELNSLSYATASDGTKSRIRIGVLPNVTAHPVLVKFDQESAVINLALSETKPTVASANSVVDNKSATQPAATAAAATTNSAASSVKAKATSGIKGAWTSAGQNLGKIASINPFAHNKQPKQPVPDADTTPDKVAVTTSSTSNSTTNAVNATSVNQANPVSAKTELAATATPTTVTPTSKASPETPGVNAVSVSTAPTSAPNSTITSLKPEISDAEIASSNKNDQLAAMPVSKTAIENAKSELPRIAANPEESKASDEPVITPLSIEQALKEKASLEAVNPKQPVAGTTNIISQPVSTESKTADNSFTSDFKTDFSKPAQESPDKKDATAKADNENADKKDIAAKPNDENSDKKDVAAKPNDEDKKEETEKLASLPSNPLDSLTSAAISNASNEPAAETEAQIAAEIKLKSQKAHAGGKDYFPPKFDDEAVDHYNAAVRAHLDGKLTEAITEYKAAIDADEKISEAYSNLGLIYNQLHKYDQAMVEFHKALAINPKDAITYNGIGAAMRAKNNLLAAIKNWQTAITLDPNLASAHYNLGTAYEINKDLEKALSQYKEAVKHDDKLGEAYYRMGLILQKMNNKNLALEEYKQAIKISQQASYASDAKRRINLLSQSKNTAM
jgi:tetratricopeptide (TPR) repeat protein